MGERMHLSREEEKTLSGSTICVTEDRDSCLPVRSKASTEKGGSSGSHGDRTERSKQVCYRLN